VRGHDRQVGQASDQASDVVGQAGAGSVRALREQGTSKTASYEWATGAASANLPRRTPGAQDLLHPGRSVTIRATLPAGTSQATNPDEHHREHHSYEPLASGLVGDVADET
jgi:hypothetical protein